MALTRLWRRQLYASLGLSVLVPLGLLISLGFLALGGFSSLSALREVFLGPAVPASQPTLGSFGKGSRPGTGLALLTGPAAAGGPVTVAAAPGSGHGAGAGSRVIASPRRPTATVGPGGSGSPPPGGSGGHHSHPSGHSQPTVVDRVVNQVTPVTSKLPPPAGSAVTKAVKSVGSGADQVLKHLPGQ